MKPKSPQGGVPSLSSASASDSNVADGETRAFRARPRWIDRALAAESVAAKLVPHRFVVHSYKRPTVCLHCRKLLVGLFRQGLQCRDCKLNIHRTCLKFVSNSCSGEVPGEIIRAENDTVDDDSSTCLKSTVDFDLLCTATSPEENEDEDDKEEVRSESFPPHKEAKCIPLQRICMSVRKSTKTGEECELLSGWVSYFTSLQRERQIRFWRLSQRKLQIVKSDITNSLVEEIPVSTILSVESAVDKSNGGHYFELEVAQKGVYYIGERADSTQKSSLYNLVEKGPGIDVFTNEASCTFERALHLAVGDLSAECWQGALEHVFDPVTGSATHASHTSSATSAQSGRSFQVIAGEEDANIQDISALYQIFPDEVLGSGQFGIVYAGVHRKKGYPIAIKVIEKLRFPSNEEAALKNEVAILHQVNFLGIVRLDHMFETVERIFIVMERLDSDMLEMVLNHPDSRLPEHIGKFLIFQIIRALEYLHAKSIAHCDLKPENCLLIGDKDYPQVKLCDFGFARIIGEKTFRKSVVGTPAYLAPEVIKNKGYNRSLDMWAAGVVAYVALSGEFPLNEDEEISCQIENAAFMYPSYPWASVTGTGIDFINSLLQVDPRRRLTPPKALIHPWLCNKTVWKDLRELEARVGERYITHPADDPFWEGIAKGSPSRCTTAELVIPSQVVEEVQEANSSTTSSELRRRSSSLD